MISRSRSPAGSNRSKLSRISKQWRGRRYASNCCLTDIGPLRLMPSVAARVVASRSRSSTSARGTKKIPSPKSPSLLPAASTASRVFPLPPGPIIVINRTSARSRYASSRFNSSSRPMNGVTKAGRGATGSGGAAAAVVGAGSSANNSASPTDGSMPSVSSSLSAYAWYPRAAAARRPCRASAWARACCGSSASSLTVIQRRASRSTSAGPLSDQARSTSRSSNSSAIRCRSARCAAAQVSNALLSSR